MVMIAPLLFLLGFASQSLTHATVCCGIFFALWLAYTVYLFRRKLFRKRYKDAPAAVWKDEDAVGQTNH
jgi:hypothetical protein